MLVSQGFAIALILPQGVGVWYFKGSWAIVELIHVICCGFNKLTLVNHCISHILSFNLYSFLLSAAEVISWSRCVFSCRKISMNSFGIVYLLVFATVDINSMLFCDSGSIWWFFELLRSSLLDLFSFYCRFGDLIFFAYGSCWWLFDGKWRFQLRLSNKI